MRSGRQSRALTAAPPAVLDDLERARLHRAVTAALEDDRPHTRPGSPPAQVSPFTRRVLAVAGAAAVVVAVLGVGSLLRDGGGTVATFEQMAPEAGADLTNGDQTFDTAADTATLQGEMQVPDAGGAENTESTAAAGGTKPRLQPPLPPTTRTARRASWRRYVCPRYPHPVWPAGCSPCATGRSIPIMPTEETALSCVDRVGQDRPGSEIDLVALLAVGDDQVEVYVVVEHSGERAALAYRTSDCTLIAER